MRRSSSERLAATTGALACLVYLACSPAESPRPPASPAPVVSAPPPPPPPPPAPLASPRRPGRMLLAEPKETPLPFTLQPIPGGRAVLAIAQRADEREAWARRIDAAGTQGPLARFVDQHVAGAVDRPDGATTFVTSDGARVCFRAAAAPPDDRACVQSSPAAVVPVGDRIALLELTTMHPPSPAATAATKAPHAAAKPKETKGAASKPGARHTTKGAKKKPGHAAPAHRPSHPLVELFLRWVDPSGVAEPEAHTTGLHFEAPLDGMALADARARPSGIDLLWYETAPNRKSRSPLGSARLMAASLRANGSLDFGSRVAVADADLEYGQLKDHHAPRLAGDDTASVFLDLDAKGECEAFVRARSTGVHLLAPPLAVCALAPDRLAGPIEPTDLDAFARILSDEPRRAFGQPRTDVGLAAWAGDRAFYLHGAALRSATLTEPARDEPAPFLAHRAHIAWGAFAPDGEAVAFAGGTLLHLGAHIDIVPAPPGNTLLSAPELPPDRRRAVRIADTWWTARGLRLRLWPTFDGAFFGPIRRHPDTTVLVGGRDRGLSLELTASALHLATVDRGGITGPVPPLVPSPIRVGFDACERNAGGALVAGVSAADPARVIAFTLDAAGRPGPAHPVHLPIRAGDLAVRLVPLPQGGAILTDLDRRHVVWISDDATPLADAPWPPAVSDAACLDGRPLPRSVPSLVPGQFVAVDDAAQGACIVGDPVWTTDGSLAWFGGTADGLDFAPEVARIHLLDVPAIAPVPPQPAAPPGPVTIPPQACPPDMVWIPGRFCIDRFEAMIVDASTGEPLSPDYPTTPNLLDIVLGDWSTQRERTGNLHARAFPLPWISPSRLGDKPHPLAVSRLGVRPSGYLTGLVAEAACAAAGKRLCTLDEFVTACRGQDDTLFPYSDTYEDGVCNVFREEHPAALLHGNASIGHLDPRLNRVLSKGRPLLHRTGDSPACRSRWGDDAVYDMVGNLDEWVDEGNGAFAGGFYARSTRSGCEALVTAHPKAYLDYSTGVRCCRDKL